MIRIITIISLAGTDANATALRCTYYTQAFGLEWTLLRMIGEYIPPPDRDSGPRMKIRSNEEMQARLPSCVREKGARGCARRQQAIWEMRRPLRKTDLETVSISPAVQG